MMLLHFLQRILKTLPLTLSSAIEYFAEQASQTIFIGSYLWRGTGSNGTFDPQGPPRPWRKNGITPESKERVAQHDRLAAFRSHRHQRQRRTDPALDRLDVAPRADGQIGELAAVR